MTCVDRERLAITDALRLRILSEPGLRVLQGYMREANYSTGYAHRLSNAASEW
jgi:hypothetical protein